MDCCCPKRSWISKSCGCGMLHHEHACRTRFITMFACMHIPDARVAASVQPALLDCASAFSPRVEDTETGIVVLDIEGLDRLFGSVAELAERLQDYTSSLGPVHVGIASNP